MLSHEQTTGRHHATHRGLTLVEAVISMLVLGVLTVGVLNLTGANARLRAVQADEARGLVLAQDLLNEVLQHAYSEPGPADAAPEETAQGTLSSITGASSSIALTVDDWIAQPINPALPADVLSWKINTVALEMQRTGTWDGIMVVQIRAATAANAPGDTVLASATIDESAIGGGWRTIASIIGLDGLTPGVGLYFMVGGVSGTGTIVNISVDGGAGGGMLRSTDGGATWVGNAGEGLKHTVMGTTIKAGSNAAVALGTDAGEVATDRSTFDDIDDFHGWQETSPTRANGEAIAGADGWTRIVAVERVTADGQTQSPAETGLKRISVKVTDPDGKITQLVSLRGRAGVSDDPEIDKSFDSLGEVTLSAGADHAVSMRTAVSTLNEPGQATENLVLNGKFEQGLNNWSATDATHCNMLARTRSGHDGGPHMRIEDVSEMGAGIIQNMTGLIENGATYDLSARFISDHLVGGSGVIGLSVTSTGGGTQVFTAWKLISNISWVHVSGSITPTWSGDLVSATLFVSAASAANPDYRIDDVEVIKR